MSEDLAFLDLVRRVRDGDEEASAELVPRFEPAIRVAVRVRLTDPGLRRVFDSKDTCQSVLGTALVHTGETLKALRAMLRRPDGDRVFLLRSPGVGGGHQGLARLPETRRGPGKRDLIRQGELGRYQ